MSLLWFNFIFGLNFIFLCFRLISIQYLETKGNKIWTKDKIEPQHLCYRSKLHLSENLLTLVDSWESTKVKKISPEFNFHM